MLTKPFTKPNTSLQYVHCESNHPPITTKNVPAGINTRLSSLLTDKATFDQGAPPFQKALAESGYTNPPYSTNQPKKSNGKTDNATTSTGTTPFQQEHQYQYRTPSLALLDKHFPKDHKLSNIFKRNNIKVSYGCRTTRNYHRQP